MKILVLVICLMLISSIAGKHTEEERSRVSECALGTMDCICDDLGWCFKAELGRRNLVFPNQY